MDESIDLQGLWETLKKRFFLIGATIVTVALLVGGYTHFLVTPMYQASTQLIVSATGSGAGTGSGVTQSEITASIQLINTYNVILTSPVILDQVIERLDLPFSANALGNRMSANNQANSQVITLTVRHEDPGMARDIANLTAEIFAHDVPDIMNVDNVSVLAPAQLPPFPVSPRLLVNVAIGLMLGTMLGIFLAFALEFLDKTVKTEEEVEKLIGVPVLGVVSVISIDDLRVRKL